MTWRRPLAVLLVLGLGLSLAACGARPSGDRLRAQRIDDPVRPDSTSARVGSLNLQHVRIQTPEGVHATGGDSAMFLTIANRGATPDTLVAVSSADAREFVVRDGADEPEDGIDVPVPAQGIADLQYVDGLHLEIRGLERELSRRQFVPVTFRFEQAGDVTFSVFVEGVDHPVVSPLPTATP